VALAEAFGRLAVADDAQHQPPAFIPAFSDRGAQHAEVPASPTLRSCTRAIASRRPSNAVEQKNPSGTE
jgi:hypothetical protein